MYSAMRRRDFLGAAAAPLLGQSKQPPNILFFLCDDLGWGDLGCYGNRFLPTPNVDRFAKQGTQFTQFYVANPVCSPSRTAFLSGHFPARHRIHGHLATADLNERRGMPHWLDPSAPMLPRLLKNAGYSTAHFGKWHLGSGNGAPEPSAYGFDDYRTVNGNGAVFDDRDETFRHRSTELFVDETIRFLGANRGRPCFVNLWTLLPHALLVPTEEDMQPFERYGPATKKFKGARSIYYASVAAIDRAFGRLMARLDEMGMAENTIVLFSSDNGPEEIFISNAGHSGVGSPGPFRGRKRSLYEGGVRVPGIVRWPGHVPARVDSASVLGSVDYLPSMAKLAGITAPEGDGEDRSAVLLGKPAPRRKPLYWEWRFNIAGHVSNISPILSMRDGDWKLLMNPDRGRLELYDIPRDPMEMQNRAAEKPDVVARMSQKVLAWRKTLPPGPVEPSAGKNDYPWPK